jgi:hypothetical protein
MLDVHNLCTTNYALETWHYKLRTTNYGLQAAQSNQNTEY